MLCYLEKQIMILVRIYFTIKFRTKEFERHGIEKRSSGYLKRKYPELHLLGISEDAIIERPLATNPYGRLYSKAQKLGIRISTKSVNDETFQIKCIK